MSASRRAREATAVETIWRMEGRAAARLYVDRTCRTGIKCPECGGKGWWMPEHIPMPTPGSTTRFDCNLCDGQGALRPRARHDLARTADEFGIYETGRTTSATPNIQNIPRR